MTANLFRFFFFFWDSNFFSFGRTSGTPKSIAKLLEGSGLVTTLAPAPLRHPGIEEFRSSGVQEFGLQSLDMRRGGITMTW